MSTLVDLQARFHEHILGLPSRVEQDIVEGGIAIEQRLNIYHNAYRVRLLENLQDAFEKTWGYLGERQFATAAMAFIEKYPPQQRNLRWHGAAFPEWLLKWFPADAEVAELALIDWQLRRAFDGPDATPLAIADFARLAPVDWETTGFHLTPTLFFATLEFNSVSIWRALDQENMPPPNERLIAPTRLLIWRKQWQPHFRTIDAVEYSALWQLNQGLTFAQVCASLARQWPDRDTSSLAAQHLATWLADELIVGLRGL